MLFNCPIALITSRVLLGNSESGFNGMISPRNNRSRASILETAQQQLYEKSKALCFLLRLVSLNKFQLRLLSNSLLFAFLCARFCYFICRHLLHICRFFRVRKNIFYYLSPLTANNINFFILCAKKSNWAISLDDTALEARACFLSLSLSLYR